MRFRFLLIIIVAFFINPAVCLKAGEQNNPATQTEKAKAELFVEGFVFNGVEGEVLTAGDEDSDKRKWLFRPKFDVEGPEGVLPAGETIELLPSSTLQKMIAVCGEGPAVIRLWARVTEFKMPARTVFKTYTGYESRNKPAQEQARAENFLFPVYFLPLSDVQEVDQGKQEPKSESPGDGQTDSILPEEVKQALKPKKIVDLSKTKKTVDVEGDMVLVNRTGTFVRHNGRYFFEVDGVGRNVSDLQFDLLPSEALEKPIEEGKLGRSRWRVSGTVTKFNNDYLLLLQRATRAYSNGNFR